MTRDPSERETPVESVAATHPADAERRRRWACEQLGIDASLSSPLVRQALFDRVRDEAFFPAPEACEAIDVIAGRAADVDSVRDESVFRRQCERSLVGQVEAFAESYFQTPPAERRARWDALFEEGRSFPVVRHRLFELEGALDYQVALPEGTSPAVSALVQMVCGLYTAPPALRGLMRRGFLARAAQDDPRELETAARSLSQNLPWWPWLDRRLIDELAQAAERRKRVIAARQKKKLRLPQQPVTPSPERSSALWIVLAMVGAVLGFLIRSERKEPPDRPPTRPPRPYQVAPFDLHTSSRGTISPAMLDLLARERKLTRSDRVRVVSYFQLTLRPQVHTVRPEIRIQNVFVLAGLKVTERVALIRIQKLVNERHELALEYSRIDAAAAETPDGVDAPPDDVPLDPPPLDPNVLGPALNATRILTEPP